MSHVNFKKWQCYMSLSFFSPQCHMSNLLNEYVACHYILAPMSHVTKPNVEIKKCPYRRVDFREEEIRTRICTIHEDREPPRGYNHPLYARGRIWPEYVHTRTEIDLVHITIHYMHEVVILCLRPCNI